MLDIFLNTVKPLLSYFHLSYGAGGAAGCLMASREGVSGTRQLAHSSSFWPVNFIYLTCPRIKLDKREFTVVRTSNKYR